MKDNSTKSLRTPQELLKEQSSWHRPLSIGIPKEDQTSEKRLAFTPEAIDMLVESGYEVVIEENAGLGINYSDRIFAENGAFITNDKKQVYACDLIFKIAPPTIKEIALMKDKGTILNMLQISDITIDVIKAMQAKQINAIAYDLMSVDDKSYPVRNSISEIEGMAAISVASEFLSNEKGGKGILLGGVPGVSPTEVIVVGAGMAGTVVAKAALALGATIKVFDNDLRKLRKLQDDLKFPVFTSVFQPNVLINAFKTADVVIGAMRYINDPVRYVISEEAVKTMKKSSLLIDLRINQGGCFETTCFLPAGHPKIFEKHGVVHYCVPNLSSRVARTTSMALSNILVPLVNRLNEMGSLAGAIKSESAFLSGCYIYNGRLVNNYLAKHFNLPSNDINLYLSIF